MARHFKEQDIAEFRDCFSLYARNDYVDSVETLMVIMRSLRTSPTPPELKMYMKNGKSSKDIQAAFRAADTHGRGVISYKELHHILSGWGEKLTAKEVEQIFREAHIKPNAPVKYEDFIKVVTSPVPDYYY